MQGLHLSAGQLRLERDLPAPLPAEGESLVEVRLAGVCATDLALARGYMGFAGVPGHEFVGVALDGPHAGQRVVGEINAGCGRCSRCLSGDGRHCPGRSVLGILGRPGAFAERLCLPSGNLLRVPAEVPDEVAVFAEPLAAALAILEPARTALARAPQGACGLVIGDGRLGLLCAHVLAATHPQGRVDLLGRHPERAAWVGPGARHWGQPLGPEPARQRYPLVVEASGQAAALAWALPWVEPRGTLVLKTTSEQALALDWAPVVIDELTIQGSRCGRLAEALAWMQSGRFDPRPLIAARLPLERGLEAFELAQRGGVLKILVDITKGQNGA